jgi:hypothetical protein
MFSTRVSPSEGATTFISAFLANTISALIPAERATQGGDPLCDSHFEAYDPDEKCPKDVCERCGRKAWAHAIGGPDYGHVCITCLPNLINNKENQRRARKRDMKRAG